jgi:hypothetical protein
MDPISPVVFGTAPYLPSPLYRPIITNLSIRKPLHKPSPFDLYDWSRLADASTHELLKQAVSDSIVDDEPIGFGRLKNPLSHGRGNLSDSLIVSDQEEGTLTGIYGGPLADYPLDRRGGLSSRDMA